MSGHHPGPTLRGVVAAAVVAAGLWSVAGATPVAADPAGPTDYRSEIVAVDPAVDGLELRIIGGDSFLELANGTGDEVLVIGYRGEPYLRFRADGVVEENRLSPSTYLNEDRFGETEIPDEVDADAAPEWRRVASDGRYAWHDHRTHWMNEARPPGAEPGDRVLEAVVPLTVGATPVDVTVISTLLAGPSPVPAVSGGAVALIATGVAVLAVGWSLGLAGTATAAAAAAATFGIWAHRSVPPETGPSFLLWLLPVTALVAAMAALVLSGRARPPVGSALIALAGAELALWSWTRREALVRAIIPSNAPAGWDRAVILAAAVVGIAAVAVGLLRLFRDRPGPL